MTDFAATRAAFHLPDGLVYMNGNSLGPLPRTATDRVATAMQDQWGDMLITAWNRAGWMDMPRRVGDRIARIIGALAGSVVMGDTLSIKVFQALSAALNLAQPGRTKVLSDTGNFPTDLYMAHGLLGALDRGITLHTVPPEEVATHLGPDVAVLMLTQVDYRTGRMHDMAALTAAAQAKGIVVIWDLAHSAGAVDLDLAGCKAEFAVGCTYKFLNGGPGAPAFIYVRPDLADQIRPILSGWLGHAAPFAFDLDYTPGDGIDRMRVGTPAILQMSALDAALDIWDAVDLADLRTACITLSERLIASIETACPGLHLISPRDPAQRGSQVCFAHDQGYAVMQALIAQGIIGDFRAPNVIRFGITPLFQTPANMDHVATTLGTILRDRLWDTPAFHTRAAVT
ncbi:MAG: kynureninase [Paracoccaceae bacterium]